MSSERAPQPGPWRKTPVWRGGAFLVGLAILLQLAVWISGGFLDLGLGRLSLLVLVGVLMSIPYGWAASHGRAPEQPAADAESAAQAVVKGEDGATFVIVGEHIGRRGERGLVRRARVRELSPGWWAVYTLLWRWPLMAGDYALSYLWMLLGRIRGFSGGPQISTGQIESAENLPPPDRDMF